MVIVNVIMILTFLVPFLFISYPKLLTLVHQMCAYDAKQFSDLLQFAFAGSVCFTQHCSIAGLPWLLQLVGCLHEGLMPACREDGVVTMMHGRWLVLQFLMLLMLWLSQMVLVWRPGALVKLLGGLLMPCGALG